MIDKFSYTQTNYKVIKLALLASFLALGAGIEAKEATDKVREFLHNEVQATNALQSGVARLTRLCAGPLKPADNVSSSESLNNLTSRVQSRSKVLGVTAQQQLNKIQESLTTAKEEQLQACSRKNWPNFLKGITANSNLEGTCEIVTSRVREIDSLRLLLTKWRDIQAQRLNLFERLINLEGAQCTRPGFAQRMVQAHESALGKFEDDLPSWINEALRPEDASRTKP